MKSYFNGGGGGGSASSATPPPNMVGGRNRSSASGQLLMGARSSSASLPRSPDDTMVMQQMQMGSGQGSLGSHHSSNQEVYVNIYQNTNHPSLFVSVTL